MPALASPVDINLNHYRISSKPFFFSETQRTEWKTFLFDKIQDYEQQER